MTKKERLNNLYQDYGLEKEDVFSHKHFTIITRQGIEKIEAKAGIQVNYDLEKCEKDFAVVKAIGTLGDTTMETYGSALKGDFKTGNTNSWYVIEIAEKRALSRIVLKLTGLYSFGVFSEDEAEDFKKSKPAVKTETL